MTKTVQVLLISALVVLCASPAFAQRNLGVRAGVSADPDQFFFGGHYETKPLLRRVTFRPNVEVGIGDDLTTIALNFEFVYSIRLEGKPARVYLGGGPAANIYNGRGGDDDTNVEPGFNFLIGVQHDRGLFGELKLGAIDSPEIKFTIGYAFR